MAASGSDRELSDVEEDLKARDGRDAGRRDSPLSVASDAVLVDTSSLTVEEQVEVVVRMARDILEGGAQR